jgi:hypothetical protein
MAYDICREAKPEWRDKPDEFWAPMWADFVGCQTSQRGRIVEKLLNWTPKNISDVRLRFTAWLEHEADLKLYLPGTPHAMAPGGVIVLGQE